MPLCFLRSVYGFWLFFSGLVLAPSRLFGICQLHLVAFDYMLGIGVHAAPFLHLRIYRGLVITPPIFFFGAEPSC